MKARYAYYRHAMRMLRFYQDFNFYGAVILWMGLATLGSIYYQDNIVTAQFSEAYSLVKRATLEEMEHYALHGAWLPLHTMSRAGEQETVPPQSGKHVAKVEALGGTIRVGFQEEHISGYLAGKAVGFRLAVSEDRPADPVRLICGHATPPAGWRVTGPDLTTLPEAHWLPRECRS